MIVLDVTILSVCSIWASKYLWETTESDGKKKGRFSQEFNGKNDPKSDLIDFDWFFIFQLYHGDQF